MKTPSNPQIQAFAQAFVRGIYGDRAPLDKTQALAFMQEILGKIVDEQITAVESLHGLGEWPRESLRKLLSDAAEIELTQILGTFSEAFGREMLLHAGPAATPASAPHDN